LSPFVLVREQRVGARFGAWVQQGEAGPSFPALPFGVSAANILMLAGKPTVLVRVGAAASAFPTPTELSATP
jgi:hypothetical protein